MKDLEEEYQIMTTQLKGQLQYISLFQPIKLFTESGEVDLREAYFNLFEKLNGVKSTMNCTKEGIVIYADETSSKVVRYEKDEIGILILLQNADGSFGMTNIAAFLPDALQRLNGRSVIVSVEENRIEITSNPDEDVFGLYYTRNNSCAIPSDKVDSICQIGTTNCCIFAIATSDGFECCKFDSSMARMLLDRYSKNEMRASRIGNCAILGRNEGLNFKDKI